MLELLGRRIQCADYRYFSVHGVHPRILRERVKWKLVSAVHRVHCGYIQHSDDWQQCVHSMCCRKVK